MDDAARDAGLLLRRAKDGDPAAFSALVRGSTVRLLIFLRRRAAGALGPDCDEEDLLQVALGRAWKAFAGFEDRGPGSLHRWLVTFCQSAITDRRRYLDAKGRSQIVQGLAPADLGRSLYRDVTSVPGRTALLEEVRAADAALRRLPETQRDVIERHYLQGESLGEIAAALGIRKNAAWERLHRGMAQLRALLPEPTPSPS